MRWNIPSPLKNPCMFPRPSCGTLRFLLQLAPNGENESSWRGRRVVPGYHWHPIRRAKRNYKVCTVTEIPLIDNHDLKLYTLCGERRETIRYVHACTVTQTPLIDNPYNKLLTNRCRGIRDCFWLAVPTYGLFRLGAVHTIKGKG